MKYKLEISKEDVPGIVSELRKNRFKPSDYLVSSCRLIDESDVSDELERTVTLGDGSSYVQPRRRKEDIVRYFETDNEEVYNIAKKLLYGEDGDI